MTLLLGNAKRLKLDLMLCPRSIADPSAGLLKQVRIVFDFGVP